ncbi:MAG: hypothetical protein IKW06_05665 [Clostridia bacterium]|nr:hypothetical protein [Clostridia bacterium]
MRSPMFYKPNIFRRILIALGITVGVLAIIALVTYLGFLYLGYVNQVKVSDEPTVTPLEFSLEPGVSYKNAANDTSLYFYSAENLKISDKNGRLAGDVSLKMPHPTLSLRGEYALFFDLNGHSTMTFRGHKEVAFLELDEKILMASINDKGYALLVTEGDLHKCAVRVFTPEGEEIFKWNSGNLAVVSADISNNSKDITVSAINTDEGKIKTHIIMFNITNEKPFTNDIYEGSLYSVVRYSGSHTYCIGSSDTLIYNSYGKCSGTVTYADRELLQYVLNDDCLVFAFSGSGGTTGAVRELKSYNHRGDELGSFACQQEFDFLDAHKGTIVINNGRTISVLNNRCHERLQLNLGIDLRDFVFFGTSSRGVGITASGAVIILLHA